MRIDGGGVQQLARAVHHRGLHAGADSRIESHRDALAGRRGEHQVLQVASEHANRFGLRLFAQPLLDVELEAAEHLDLPGPAHRLGQPRIRGPAALLDAGARGNAPLGNGGTGDVRILRQDHGQAQESFLAPAQHRERAMRRRRADGFTRIEVIGELRALVFLAGHDPRSPFAAIPQQLTQSADQLRVFRERLHQDPARAFERGSRIGDALVGIDEARRFALGHERRVLQQANRQRFEARFARDLALGPPLRLERQVQVFEPGLGVRAVESRSRAPA